MGTARTLVTGSAGHLGEALMRVLRGSGEDAVGLDLKRTPFTDRVGSITERRFVRECIRNVDVVLHTATLHKPHIATHTRQAFIDTNITGTLNLLEEAVAAGAKSFVFTSSTSVFGHSLRPAEGEPARWITEELAAQPRNIYGVTSSPPNSCANWSTARMPCRVWCYGLRDFSPRRTTTGLLGKHTSPTT